MTAIRINPEQVRRAGVTAIACADDLRTQAALVNSTVMPAMPVSMAARHQAALAGVATRLGALASEYASIGEELQVRAAAAEVADAPGDGRTTAAGQQLSRAITTTTTIVGVGGATTSVRLRTSERGTVASTNTGTRLQTDDSLRSAPARVAGTPDPHAAPHALPASSRDIAANQPVGGAPAAAVQQAAAAAPADPVVTVGTHEAHVVDPADMPPGEHRAGHADSGHATPAPVDTPPPHETDRQRWACWMAATAAHEGLPPTLPVMIALAHSGLRNMPAGQSDAGFFGIDPHHTHAPAGAGVGRGAELDGDWWVAHPDAQLDHIVGRLSGFGGGIRTEQLDDPEALSRWAVEAAPGIDTSQLTQAHAAASELVGDCPQQHAAGVAPAGGPLAAARSQLGVHEVGTNAGPRVDEYLSSAHAASGNPWCASFVTWSMQESGHEMPGSGWAAVSTWVQAAESGQHGLQIVDAASARPGDIVAYDWGGQSDFGQDGHIGFLASYVEDGRFTTIEGNAQDAVTRMDRSLGVGNVVFIRAS